MIRRAILSSLLALAGCSLVAPIGGAQPCDDGGACLPGFACVNGLCVPGGGSGDGGGPGGCSDSTQCPAGGCSGGACADWPLAWGDGGAEPAAMACYPWPPTPVAGNPDVTLAGCIALFPVQPEPAAADAGSVQPFEDGYALGGPVPLVAEPACPSGLGYRLQLPPGQLVDVAVTAPGWAGGALQQDVLVPAIPDAGPRQLDAISINGWSQELHDLQTTLGLAAQSQAGLVLGTVRDCAGRPLSGVQLASTQDGGAIAFGYLDDSGAPEKGRSATGPSGRFAAVAFPGSYRISFLALPSAGAAPEPIATLSVSVTADGTAFVELAPSGP